MSKSILIIEPTDKWANKFFLVLPSKEYGMIIRVKSITDADFEVKVSRKPFDLIIAANNILGKDGWKWALDIAKDNGTKLLLVRNERPALSSAEGYPVFVKRDPFNAKEFRGAVEEALR